MSSVKWGVLGAGNIVRRWMRGARAAGADIRAVGSRTPESARRAAGELAIPCFGVYEDILSRGDIDAVYVAVCRIRRILSLRSRRCGAASTCLSKSLPAYGSTSGLR